MRRWAVVTGVVVVVATVILATLVVPRELYPSAGPSPTGPMLPSGHYLATFTETGLQNGTPWSVFVNGTSCLACLISFNGTIVPGTLASTSASNLSFELVNGTYPFFVEVPGPLPYNMTISWSSPLDVDGTSITISIAFQAGCCLSTLLPPSGSPYLVTFTESGLSGGAFWSVGFNGSSLFANAMSLSFLVGENGSYPFNVTTTSDILFPSPASGTLVVNGSSVTPQQPWDMLGLTQLVTFTTSDE